MSSLAPFHRVERDAAAFLLSAPADGDHLVHFSEEDATLFEAVGRFLGAGLNAGDRLIVIATPEHQGGFVQHLKGFNVDRAIASGQLLLLDARETLGRFMVNDSPDRNRFHETLNELLARATGGHGGTRVRIYAEGVDLLWHDGLASAAILVEALWNEAGFAHAFSLMCAYTMANFHEHADGMGLADLCRAHSHVLPIESSTFTEGIAKSLLEEEMRRLQDRVRSLELENKRLRELEKSGRRSSSERLHQGEACFRLLIDSVRDYAIFILDPSGIVSTWNPGAERIKGYRAEEIIGRHFSTFYPAEDVEAGKCDRELAVATELGRFEDDAWRLRKDGSRFWANVVMAPLRGPAGAVIGFAKITRDLTERVAAERERLQLVCMEEAERRKDELLAIKGQELRNPLAPLVTAAHMIRLRGGRATEKEMGILDRQLRQMTKIVADLLDASHGMRDKIELTPRVMEIGEVLANAVDLAAPFIEERRHELLIDVPHRSFLVNVDPERMAQVFGNVLHNAAKYTPIGGTIRLRAELRGDEVEATVEDNGQGIAPHVIGQVFDLFQQGAAGLERARGGFGIGLAFARKMVREHHGHITAESDGVGHGSRFTIRLPVAAVDPQMASRTSALPAPRATVVRRVLVADDNRDAAEMMQAMLEQRGHELRLAFDGLEALRVCSEFEPDTVFLDIGLPGMDGYEVARRMRRLPAGEKLQIVAVSGYAREEDRARALASGFTAHLAKPVDLDHISKVLED